MYRNRVEQSNVPPKKVIFYRWAYHVIPWTPRLTSPATPSDGVSEGQFKTVLEEGQTFTLLRRLTTEASVSFQRSPKSKARMSLVP